MGTAPLGCFNAFWMNSPAGTRTDADTLATSPKLRDPLRTSPLVSQRRYGIVFKAYRFVEAPALKIVLVLGLVLVKLRKPASGAQRIRTRPFHMRRHRAIPNRGRCV